MAEKQIKGDYKTTTTYKNADSQTKRKLESYKKENRISDAQMYLLLLRQDYRDLPKEEKQRGNRPAELIVISGIVTFLVMTANDRKDLLPYAAVYMIVAAVLYFSGILNPVARSLNNINKLLKKYPEVPDIRDVLNEKEENE